MQRTPGTSYVSTYHRGPAPLNTALGAMSRGLLFLPLCLICSSVVAAATGTVCIGPVPVATSGAKSLANATASEKPYNFSVAIDELAPVAVSHLESVVVSGLRTSQRHEVAIRQGGERFASFTFTFEEHQSERLCLWFGPLYESWSLWPLQRSKGKCSCGAEHGT